MSLRFDNRVVIVTGGGAGIGRTYSLEFANRGAKVVVNDVTKPAADKVVEEIRLSGGQAVPNQDSVTEGEKVIKTAIEYQGRIDILINNAGIIRDTSLKKMDDSQWDQVIKVHLQGTQSCTRAAWTHFMNQGYGRIINTSSGSGAQGNFGQTNYSSAKLGIASFTFSCAQEGANKNVYSNVIAPLAATDMTKKLLPEELQASLNPHLIAPLVVQLAHESSSQNGLLLECAGGQYGRLKIQNNVGPYLGVNATAEDIANNIDKITNMTGQIESRDTMTEWTSSLIGHILDNNKIAKI